MKFLATNYDLKVILPLLVLIISLFPIAYGQTTNELGYRLFPGKIVENGEGILQIYALKDGIIFPDYVKNLVVTSSDSSIIQILDISENENGFATDVKIKAVGSGDANIAIAASGYSSKEFPVTVYGTKHDAATLLIKAVPNTFSINGPTKGYISIELADEDGFPTIARDDVEIRLSTSKNDVITLQNKDLIIKKGEYFVISEFQVNPTSDAEIFASSGSMETVSTDINVSELSEPLKIQLYLYPEKLSSFTASHGYAIVELQDSEGNPVKSKENIPISLTITKSNQTSVNTSSESSDITANEALEIKKDSYWAYTKLVTRAGQEGTYDISISAKDYLVADTQQLEVSDLELIDDKSAKLDLIPILATGREELVGVMHLEDDDEHPVAASKTFTIKVNSVDEKSLAISDVKIEKGHIADLVYGKVGYATSEALSLHVLNGDNQIVTPAVSGPEKESMILVTEPIISKVLYNSEFPLVAYMSQSDNTATYFPEALPLSVSPNEFVQVESKVIEEGESVALLDSKSIKKGSSELTLGIGDFSDTVLIDNLTSKPAAIHLDYPESILTNFKNTFSIQVLDGQGLPIFADHDTELKLVSNDNSVLEVPENVIIKKGDYYTLFDVNAKEIGTTEISVLASDLQLTKFEMQTESMSSEITMDSPDYINPNTDFDIMVNAQYLGDPLSAMSVEWNVQGAEIRNMASITDENGQATISLRSPDAGSIDIQVTVSGGLYSPSIINKQITINQPLQSTGTNFSMSDFMGINPFLIIIPAIAVGVIIFLKKKGMLEDISEKIIIVEKISNLKERISQSRN